MNTQINSEVTIDELAIMIGKGFSEYGDKLESLRSDVSNGFSAVDNRFDALEKRVSNIEENMATKSDIERLEGDIARLDSKYDNVEKVIFKDHSTRLRRVERHLQLA